MKKLKLVWKNIVNFFIGIYNSVQKSYNFLSEKEKEVSKQASGIIAIINENLDKTPEIVWQIISNYYPEITKEKLLEILTEVGKVFNILDETFEKDLEHALQKVMDLLKTVPQGNTWVTVTRAIVEIALGVLAPGTPIQKFLFVIEYVYKHFIKGKVTA